MWHIFFFARLLSLGQGRHATVVMIVGSAHLCTATAKKIALALSVVLVLNFMLAERWPVRRPSWTVARNCHENCWKVRVCVRIRRSLRFRSPWFWSWYVHCQEHHHCCRQTLPSRRSVVPAKFSASVILLVFSPLGHGVIVLASGISSRRRAWTLLAQSAWKAGRPSTSSLKWIPSPFPLVTP